jgi:hypothetical protein
MARAESPRAVSSIARSAGASVRQQVLPDGQDEGLSLMADLRGYKPHWPLVSSLSRGGSRSGIPSFPASRACRSR